MDAMLEDIDLGDEDVEMVEEEQEEMTAAALTVAVNEAPVVKLINAILTDALHKGASDVHFECFEKDIRVRYRIDGALREIMKPPFKMRAALISRFKIMAGLNIAERRVPQDGRIKLKIGRKVIDFRVSTLPTLFGEKVVLRILDKGNLTLELEKFGIEPRAERELMEAVQNPYGMVLVTGPTGSGKTTTLYSALSKVNTVDVNIMTAEDPVEYNLYGINQVQVRTEIGMSVRRRAQGVPASGSEHHHGRRDSRSRDRRHRHQGGAHRPPRDEHAAHQLRARDGHASARHGSRAVQRRERAQPHSRAAARAPHLLELQDALRPRRRRARRREGHSDDHVPRAALHRGGARRREVARDARSAAAPQWTVARHHDR